MLNMLHIQTQSLIGSICLTSASFLFSCSKLNEHFRMENYRPTLARFYHHLCESGEGKNDFLMNFIGCNVWIALHIVNCTTTIPTKNPFFCGKCGFVDDCFPLQRTLFFRFVRSFWFQASFFDEHFIKKEFCVREEIWFGHGKLFYIHHSVHL